MKEDSGAERYPDDSAEDTADAEDAAEGAERQVGWNIRYYFILWVMLNKLLPVALISCLFFSCGSAPSKEDCNLYKKGSFKAHIKNDSDDYFVKGVRDDSFQIEMNEKTGVKDMLRIQWTGPCSYTLKLIETTENLPDSVLQWQKSLTMNITILWGNKDYYVYDSKVDGYPQPTRDTIWMDHANPRKIPVTRPAR